MRGRLAGALATVGVAAVSLGAAATASANPVNGSVAPAAATTPAVGSVPSATQMQFQVNLALSDPAGAAAFARSVSDPSSSSYEQYLTPAQWEAQFSPSSAAVSQVKSFLHSSGFAVGSVSADRMTVDATGSVAKIEQAFGTQLTYHQVQGEKLILNDTALSVPSSVAGDIVGVSGISQTVAVPSTITKSSQGSIAAAAPGATTSVTSPAAKPPPGSNNAQPCSQYWGQIAAASFPPVPGGYPADAPYATCGYTPPQLRGAYNLPGTATGAGVTVAIVDAYASPTLFADAHEYAALNDPSNPLPKSQFSELLSPTFNDGPACQTQSGWYPEQHLDVEAVHAAAPRANILYAGAQNCENGLNDMIQKIVDKHLANVITNSYGDPSGDLLDSSADRAATDNLLQMAAGTGVSVLFSSGDNGDGYSATGTTAPGYPASSPWATAVGGTSLEVGQTNNRLAEYGWSTASSLYCNADAVSNGYCPKSQLGTWAPLRYQYGSGGGTSYSYIQPYYQANVVPTSLSELRSKTAMRVVPDVSMDGDPFTGMLIGLTQTYPNGTYYGQYTIGGTSLASPLMAGVIARADQTAGKSLGFVNPKLYSLYGNANALNDIVSPTSPQDTIASIFFNGVNANQGTAYVAAALDYQGSESYCPTNAQGVTKCVGSQPITLATTPGYDNMTGLGSPGNGFVGALAGH